MNNNNKKQKLTISEADLENDAKLEIHLRKIKRQELKEYFSLTIFRITLLGMLTAVNLTLAIISHYVLGYITIFPTADFLKIEITFISYLIIYLCTNGFYAIVMIFPLTWLRLPLIPSAEPIGLISMNLSDGIAMIVFVVIMYFLKKYILFKTVPWIITKLLIAAIITTIVANFWNIFANFTFLFKLYGIGTILNTWPMAGILFAFNSIKYLLNFVAFIFLYKPLVLSFNKYERNL